LIEKNLIYAMLTLPSNIFYTVTLPATLWFPKAQYEDVTGLCKLANPADVKEQEYSLNPGRYVGVVIEEDGKTEEEFVSEMLDLGDELSNLSRAAGNLEANISANIKALIGDV
jgi:type I restriction enzyme M protein